MRLSYKSFLIVDLLSLVSSVDLPGVQQSSFESCKRHKLTCFGLQVMVTKEIPTVEGLLAGTKLSDENILAELLHPEAGLDVNPWDLINRGNAA